MKIEVEVHFKNSENESSPELATMLKERIFNSLIAFDTRFNLINFINIENCGFMSKVPDLIPADSLLPKVTKT